MTATRFDMTVNGDGTGSKLLPINLADVTYMSPALSTVSRRVSVYIEFYNSAGIPVTPTGGMVHITGRPMGQLWLDAVNSPLNSTDIKATVATYTMPYMEGLVSRVAARFVGVTGVATASVAVYREDRVELRVGPSAAAVAAGGSGGFSMPVWESGITGIALMIGAGIQNGGQMFADVPSGWYFQINRLSGTAATVVSCFSRSLTA